jgi:hypothetical protein
LDTRAKIISAADAQRLASDGAMTVSGYFDPLTVAHAERLKGLKGTRPLLVVIAEPVNPILPSLARAQLVAGLACVDHVTIDPVGFTLQAQLEREDNARLEELIRRVQARQQAAQ